MFFSTTNRFLIQSRISCQFVDGSISYIPRPFQLWWLLAMCTIRTVPWLLTTTLSLQPHDPTLTKQPSERKRTDRMLQATGCCQISIPISTSPQCVPMATLCSTTPSLQKQLQRNWGALIDNQLILRRAFTQEDCRKHLFGDEVIWSRQAVYYGVNELPDRSIYHKLLIWSTVLGKAGMPLLVVNDFSWMEEYTSSQALKADFLIFSLRWPLRKYCEPMPINQATHHQFTSTSYPSVLQQDQTFSREMRQIVRQLRRCLELHSVKRWSEKKD